MNQQRNLKETIGSNATRLHQQKEVSTMTIQSEEVLANNTLAFWKEGCEATARHAVNLLRMAGKEATCQNVIALIHSAPRSDTEVRDNERRRTSFCRRCLDIATTRLADAEALASSDLDAAEFHFLITMPGMDDATRKLLLDSFSGIIRGFGLVQLDTIGNA